jgi:DeoR/GlpR family transcriptional regulator of sugar metabolism
MLAETRRQKILELIQENGSARVTYLSETFEVTEQTIRQDLKKIEESGDIIREHGGAFLKNYSQGVKEMSLHHLVNMDKKAIIGRTAANLINDGDSVILDSGSTTTEIAKNLQNKNSIRVITNSLNIALLLGANPNIEMHMTGGEFKAPTLSLTGEKAAIFFQQTFVDKLFLATAGIHLPSSLMYPSYSDLPVKAVMIESAREVYLVADSTKIGKAALAVLNKLDQVNFLITDKYIKDDDRKQIETLGIKVIIAE